MTAKEKNGGSSRTGAVWNPEDEVHLFYALDGLKPVGINKHFYMVCVAERLNKLTNVEFSTDQIWSHLYSMYNLDAIDAEETLPFPNEQKDFTLPVLEYSSLMAKKRPEDTLSRERSVPGTCMHIISIRTSTSYQFKFLHDFHRKISRSQSD